MSVTAQRIGKGAALLVAFILLSGFGPYPCEMGTYECEKYCLEHGCLGDDEERARADYEKAKKDQVELNGALAALQEQQATLATELSNAETTFEQLGRRLDQSCSTTAAQRQQFQRLDEKWRQLQRDFDRAKAAPPPPTALDATTKQFELDRLTEEKAGLEDQIKVLQEGL